ncbi:MFS transporter [Thalassospira mesophila]|uniref:Transporter n=1 Tax=Thalassospira mesophila TaxID=1293891 RepID=A0A1Y2KZI9_9PROT|nr:MFS transporter [Thalassospira mesophila]OSQ38255.1 hypothetical protein TMES_10180 [Thalassospira mesophila]
MITPGLTIRLGLAQMISWGTAYYLIGNFGPRLSQYHGWSETVIYGGFSLALLVMGIVSPLCGKLIDRHGGRMVMAAGSLFNVAGCLTLATCNTVTGYFAAWLVLGIAMRLTLYDAAFAALARIGGQNARRAMGQITLFGGLASTVFWPLGHYLDSRFGLTAALLCYAGFAALTLPLHLALPGRHHGDQTDINAPVKTAPAQKLASSTISAAPLSPRHQMVCGLLYALIMSLINIINAAMSAHMISLLAGLGLAGAAAINIASLRGIGQTASRLADTIFGRNFNPATVTIGATLVLGLAFVPGLAGTISITMAGVFAVAFGAANGVLTITRGTLPLMIFAPGHYGKKVGVLLLPGFILSALAPSLFAMALKSRGAPAVFGILAGLSFAALLCALLLRAKLDNAQKKPSAP